MVGGDESDDGLLRGTISRCVLTLSALRILTWSSDMFSQVLCRSLKPQLYKSTHIWEQNLLPQNNLAVACLFVCVICATAHRQVSKNMLIETDNGNLTQLYVGCASTFWAHIRVG